MSILGRARLEKRIKRVITFNYADFTALADKHRTQNEHINWLVVSTHLKTTVYKSNWKSCPNRGEHKKYVKPPPSSETCVGCFWVHLSNQKRKTCFVMILDPTWSICFHTRVFLVWAIRSVDPEYVNFRLSNFMFMLETCLNSKIWGIHWDILTTSTEFKQKLELKTCVSCFGASSYQYTVYLFELNFHCTPLVPFPYIASNTPQQGTSSACTAICKGEWPGPMSEADGWLLKILSMT